MTENVIGRAARKRPERRAYVQLGALLVLALTAFAATWLLVRGGGNKTTLPPASAGAAAVSEAQLRLLAKAVDHPVYWAGPKPGAYELTRTNDGRIYIRYLPSADKVGDRAPRYLTIGTYPTKTAYVGLLRAATHRGAVSLKIDHGGLLVLGAATPKSVYFAYPKKRYQIEVYDPSPQRARALVLGGQINPIR